MAEITKGENTPGILLQLWKVAKPQYIPIEQQLLSMYTALLQVKLVTQQPVQQLVYCAHSGLAADHSRALAINPLY